MDDNVPKLRSDRGELQWTVVERVLVEWNDKELGQTRYLGRLSPHNRTSKLTLCVGRDTNDNVLISIHMPIKIVASSSKPPKHMYFIVPSEALTVSIPEVVHINDLHQRTVDALNNAHMEANTSNRIIRVNFDLSKPGHVIMPVVELKNAIQGRPRDLLWSLRSLSQSTNFDVYLKYDTLAEVELDDLHSKLRSPYANTSTPDIPLAALYNGRGGDINAWDKYPFARTSVRVQMANAAVNPMVSDPISVEPPPAYCTDVFYSRPRTASPAKTLPTAQEPDNIREGTPTSTPASAHGLVPDSTVPIPAHAHIDSLVQVPRSLNGSSPRSTVGSNHFSQTPSVVPASPPSSHAHPAEAVGLVSPQSANVVQASVPAGRAENAKPPHSTLATGAPQQAEVRHASVSKAAHPASGTEATRSATTLEDPHRASRKRKATNSHPSDDDNDLTELTLEYERIHNPFALEPPHLRDITQWLVYAWKLAPLAHKQLFEELCVLGAAISDNIAFKRARDACSVALFELVADGSALPAENISLREDYRRLISWLNEMDNRTDLFLQREYVELVRCAREVENGGGEKAITAYHQQKGFCIAVALFFFTSPLNTLSQLNKF